ncbi:MAG: GAF domain-containing protein, partial [Bryobacterales bacterium]|nr:GAF domain-containing protein [Bryobacterales bacterium]
QGEAGLIDVQRARVLILAPIGRDAELASTLLGRERLTAEICPDVKVLVAKLRAGAGTAVIADEALNGNIPLLQDWVKTQPAWSDFPFIVLSGGNALPRKMQERLAIMQPLGNITLLERPLRSITLLTVVRAALRARARQYEVEHYIQDMRQAEADRLEAYAREEAAQAQIELLNHVGQILSAELNLDALLQAVVDAGTHLSGADAGIFFSQGVVDGTRKFALRCTSGLPIAEATELLGQHGIVDAAQFSSKKLVRCSGLQVTQADGREAWIQTVAGKLSFESCIALAVMSRPSEVAGVLLFGRRSPESFSGRDESIAANLASQAAIAIDNARLFSAAQQERRRLEAARQVLQRSNEELRQFAYIASHDLQEPLRTVASFTQLLVTRYRQHAGPEAAEFVNYIVEGVERMSLLIHDLRQYSSTGASRTLPSQPASLERALNEVLLALSTMIRNSGAIVTHDALPSVWVENHSLVSLLQNLIANAIKYRGAEPPHIHFGPNRRTPTGGSLCAITASELPQSITSAFSASLSGCMERKSLALASVWRSANASCNGMAEKSA